MAFFLCSLVSYSGSDGTECFTLAAGAILGEPQTFPAAPAGVRSRDVQAQLARANIVHQALVNIWKEEYGHTGLQSLA